MGKNCKKKKNYTIYQIEHKHLIHQNGFNFLRHPVKYVLL